MEYRIPTQADTVVVEEIVNRKLRNSMLWMVWGLLTLVGCALPIPTLISFC